MDEVKPKLALKGIIYYLRNNLNDRYFCTKIVNTLIELIKKINSNIPDKRSQEIADSFFKYIENILFCIQRYSVSSFFF